MDDLRYYAAYVTTSGRTAWRWSEPFGSAKEAAARIREKLDTGDATMGCIVRAQGDRREVLGTSFRPPSVCRIIGHYESLLDSLED